MAIPDWIANAQEPLGELPLHDLLSGSVYYPACRFDGRPVQLLGRDYQSFVYVDCGVTKEQHLKRLQRSGQEITPGEFDNHIEASDDLGFLGYRLLAWRDVAERELTLHGWHRLHLDPACALYHIPVIMRPRFAIWSILERSEAYDDTHGPRRFSLLYVGADGVESFAAMYWGNNVAPAVVAVIQPGDPCLGNRARLEDPDGIFARLVRDNPAGPAEYLLCRGSKRPFWSAYGREVHCFFNGDLKLWRRREDTEMDGQA